MPPSNAILKADIRYITCDPWSRVAAYSVDFYFGDPQNDDPDTIPLESSFRQTGGFRFNTKAEICAYEMNLERLALATGLYETRDNMDLLPQIKAETVANTCGAIMAVCQGENQQYDDFQACVDFMDTIPLGNWDLADQDNVVCRQLHVLLAAFRPDVHCSHCGVDGGGKCYDKTYTESTGTDFLFGEQCDE